MRTFSVLLPAFVFLSAWRGGTGWAADPAPPLRVAIPGCPSAPFVLGDFPSALQVELAGHGPPCCRVVLPGGPGGGDEAPGPEIRLAVEPCAAEATSVEVSLSDPPRPVVHRRVELAGIAPNVRARAVALAAAELVRTSSQAPAAAPPGGVKPAVVIVPPTTAPPPAPRPRRLHVSLLVEGQAHPGNNMLLVGVRPSLMIVRGRWQGTLDVQFASGDSSVDMGSVSTTVLTGTIAAGPRFSLGRVRLDVSACGTVGEAWMRGTAADPDTTTTASGSGVVAGASGRVGIEVPTRWQVSYIRALVEGGGMIRGLDATVSGRAAAGVAGGYVVVAVGFGSTL